MRLGEFNRLLGRRPARRTGVMAALLLLGTTAAALVLASEYHQDIPAILITVLVGLPVLYLTWAAYSGAKGETMEGVADSFARVVRKQWTEEVRIRGLNDHVPLPVSWSAADPSLTDSWDLLVNLATEGPGWPSPPPSGTWAASSAGLDGKGRELADRLSRVPTGRLVVLGAPGAGKTILMVRLILDLLGSLGARRASSRAGLYGIVGSLQAGLPQLAGRLSDHQLSGSSRQRATGGWCGTADEDRRPFGGRLLCRFSKGWTKYHLPAGQPRS